MTTEIRHGTYYGYQQHTQRRRDGESGDTPCAACRAAAKAYQRSLRAKARGLFVIPGRGPQHPQACRGSRDRQQDGIPGDREAPERLAPRLYAVQGPTTTCGHDNPTIAVRLETGGEVLSCRRCVLTAVDDRPGVTYLEPQPGGGDDAA